MAKQPKMRLKMADDYEVKDLPGFREHFDWNFALQYFRSGELRTWLRARYYDYEADALEHLRESDAEFPKKFCEILGVEVDIPVGYVPPKISSPRFAGRPNPAPKAGKSRILAMPKSSKT